MIQYITALYGRTSKDDRKRVTIEIQQDALRKWSSTDDGISVVAAEFWDDGVSGKIPLGERQGGRQLMSLIREGRVKCVAVLYADRFGRTLLHGLQAAAELESMGVKIVCVGDGWDSRRNDSKLNFQLRLLLAEEEHRKIAERMESGKERAALRDGAIPGGPVTFGYTVLSDGKYEVNPVEATIVSGVYERALVGQSNREILKWAREQGVRAGRRSQKREGAIHIQECHATAQWHPGKIGRMLRQTAYKGVRTWRGQTFACPRIVDDETWERVQVTNRDRSARYTPKVFAEEALLSTMFTCDQCGQAFYFHRWASKTRKQPKSGGHQYQCGGKAQKNPCKSKYLPVHLADELVWDTVKGYLDDPETLIAKAVEAGAAIGAAVAENDATEGDLLTELRGVESEVAGVWAEQRANKWPMEWVAPRLNDLNERRKLIERQVAAIRRERAEKQERQADTTAVVPLVAAVRAKLAAGVTRELKHEIIRLMVAGGVVRTIGTGRQKSAELTIRLRWGDTVQPVVARSTSGTDDDRLLVPVTLAFPSYWVR